MRIISSGDLCITANSRYENDRLGFRLAEKARNIFLKRKTKYI